MSAGFGEKEGKWLLAYDAAASPSTAELDKAARQAAEAPPAAVPAPEPERNPFEGHEELFGKPAKAEAPKIEAPTPEPRPDLPLEGQRVARLIDSLTPAQLIDSLTPAQLPKAAKVMRLYSNPDLASKLSGLFRRLRIAARAEADFEAKGRKMVPEQDRAYTPLLEWMRGTKIAAWPGAPYAAEITEAVAGRPALRKFFEFQAPAPGAKPSGGYLDQVVEDAQADTVSGFKDDTPSDLLDQLTREADTLEAGGKKGLTELLDRGDEKAQAMAQSIREAYADTEAARRAAVDAMLPHITSGKAGITEAQLLEAVGKVEARAVMAEAAATEAKAKGEKAVTAAKTAGERRVERMKVRAAERARKAKEVQQTKDLRAEIDKQHAVNRVQLEERLRAEELQRKGGVKVAQKVGEVTAAKEAAKAERQAKREAVAKALETGRANVASLMLRLKAKRQSEDDIRAGLIAVLKRMPEGIRGKLLARVRAAINEKRVASALEQAWKYLTERHQRALINSAKKTAGKIRKARLEFDKDAPILKVADDAWTKLKREMMAAVPGETPEDVVARLLELKNSLIEAWHEHRNAKTLYTLQGMASAEDAVRSVQKDIEQYDPKQPGTGTGVMPATPERGMAARGEALARKTDSLIEGALGPWDGVLDKMLVHNLGVNPAPKHYAEWYAVRDPINAAAKKANGGDLLSEKDLRWKEEPLTFDVGGKSVTAERRFWLLLRAVFKDEDAAGKWLKRTEAENPEPATFVWSTRLGDVAGSFKSADEAYAWADAFDAADPKGGQYVDEVLAALNAPGRFERADSVHRQVYGTRLEQVPGTRVPTRYNVKVENQPRVPDFSQDTPQGIMRHLSQHFSRKPGGRGISMIIGDFDQVILTDAWESAAFNNYAPPLRDAWTLLAQMVEHGEKPVTFEAWLAERVGRDVPAKLQQQIRHVAAQVGLSPRMRADTGGIDPAFRRILHNAQGAAVGGLNIGPPINQVPPVILPLADTARPMKLSAFLGALKDFAAGGWREAVDTLKRLRPDIRFRAELADVQQHISPSVSSPTGYGANRLWRLVQKAIRVTGRPMIFMDLWNRAIQFLAARRQLASEKPELKGEVLDQAAADLAAWWMYRVDAPMHPAYETPVGRAARESTAVAAVTAFTQGRIAGWNVILRAIDDYRRTGDVGALARRLGIAVFGLAALFTAGGALISVLSGRKPGEARGGIAGDFAENAIGQVYGGQELARLIRGKTPVVSSPPLQAMERFGSGVASMHGAIEKGDRTRMLGASVNMIRGAAHLAGIPTNQAANLVRLVRAHTGAAAEIVSMSADVLSASGPAGSVASIRGRMTLAQARTALRKLAKERGMDPKELAERLKRLTDRYRGRAAA
jgi:hypothetical protein